MEPDASRVRRPSRRFGWVDRRILYDGHLATLGPTEIALYLVLCVVADRHGLSWYSLATLAAWTKHPRERVQKALVELARHGLVAICGRLVQVVDLDWVGSPLQARRSIPAVDPVSDRTDRCPHPRSVQTAPDRLAQVPAHIRDDVLRRAREKLVRITNGREPSRLVLEAVASGMIRDSEGRS